MRSRSNPRAGASSCELRVARPGHWCDPLRSRPAAVAAARSGSDEQPALSHMWTRSSPRLVATAGPWPVREGGSPARGLTDMDG